MNVAIIPARGGSKRIPRKNIKPFFGKPIIAWSIEAALSSDCFERVLVSTDDPEIADVARSAGAEVPFSRPAELCDDFATTSAVMGHAVDWLRASGYSPEWACCLYATAPFVRPDDLRRGLQAMQHADGDFALSVTDYAFPIQRAVRIDPDGRLQMFDPDKFDIRSQDLEPAFHDAGQFYWGRADAWSRRQRIFDGAWPVRLPRERVQDIDTPEDWARAELIFGLLRSHLPAT